MHVGREEEVTVGKKARKSDVRGLIQEFDLVVGDEGKNCKIQQLATTVRSTLHLKMARDYIF